MFDKLPFIRSHERRYRYAPASGLPATGQSVEQVRDAWADIHASDARIIQELQADNEQVSALLSTVTDLATEMTRQVEAARHLMNVLSMRTETGVAPFRLNEDATTDNIEILAHAVLDLQAKLEGTEVPAFILAGVTVN